MKIIIAFSTIFEFMFRFANNINGALKYLVEVNQEEKRLKKLTELIHKEK